MDQFLNLQSYRMAQQIYMSEFQSNWKNLPEIGITVKRKCGACGLNSMASSDFIEVNLNILQMVVLMCKHKILDLLLDEHEHKPTEDDWIEHYGIAKETTKMAKCYFSPLHLASKLNPKGLYKILASVLADDEKKRATFWKKDQVKEILHNAVRHPSSLTTR